MKQEDFFKIMDGASEQDITELMQHRRFRQIPADQEEHHMEQTDEPRKKGIRMRKRGMITGSAVAAVLLALNIGGGYLLSRSRAGDDLLSVTSEECVVSEAETLPETTVTVSGTELAATTVRASEQYTITTANATTAASERGSQTTEKPAAGQTAPSGTGTAENTTAKMTAKTSANTSEKTTAKTTADTTAKNTAKPVQTTTAPPETDTAEYMLIPADRPYEVIDGEAVCHAKPSEQIKMMLQVENGRGSTFFYVPFNISKFDYLPDPNTMYCNIGGTGNGMWLENCDDRILTFRGMESEVSAVPFNGCLTDFKLLAPAKPGRYVLRECGAESDLARDPSDDSKVTGITVIVDEEDLSAVTKTSFPVKPDTAEGLTFFFMPTVAHAGEKNVPVDVLIQGNGPFEAGELKILFDSALKPVTDAEQLVLRTEGTLLAHAPEISGTAQGGELEVTFNNRWKKTDEGYESSDRYNTVIRGDGELFTLYFDMPEECGRYRLNAWYGSLDGYTVGCDYQSKQGDLPGEIVVVP